MPSLHSSTTGLLAGEAEPVNMQAGGQASRTRLQHLPQGWRGDVWSVALHAEQHILSVKKNKNMDVLSCVWEGFLCLCLDNGVLDAEDVRAAACVSLL